jgi:flagellar protein FliL
MVQSLEPFLLAACRAEKVTKGRSTGKNFLPDGPLQVSINHSCLAWLLSRHLSGAESRFRHRWLGFVVATACALTQAGTVMADKKDAKPETEDGAAPAAKAGGKSRKLIIMIVGGVIGLGVLGGGGYFFMGHHSAEATAAAAPQPKAPIFVDMPDVLVNLSSSGSERTQYLKVKIALELPDEQVQAQITPVMPRLLDTFQTYLRELRPADLDGSAGLYRLKEELTRRVDAAISPSKINAVLFKEIVVQ